MLFFCEGNDRKGFWLNMSADEKKIPACQARNETREEHLKITTTHSKNQTEEPQQKLKKLMQCKRGIKASLQQMRKYYFQSRLSFQQDIN